MANYAKNTLVTQYSANSDYSDPQINHTITKERTTPTELLDITLGCSDGAGTAVTWTTFSTLTGVVIVNLSSTSILTATYRTGGGGATTQTIAIPVSDFVRLVDVTASTVLTLTHATASQMARVIAYGT